MTEPCGCATEFRIRLGRRIDYRRAKTLLNHGQHPTFVGRRMAFECIDQGGLLFASYQGVDVAVLYIRPKTSTLWVVNVMPEHRGHGLGAAVLAYAMPNFARVIEDKVPWFERNDYVAIGAWKEGRRFRTRIMVRRGVMEVAGRVSRVLGERCRCAAHPEDHPVHAGQDAP